MEVNLDVKFDGRGMFEQEIIERILENRDVDDVEHFLNPTEDDLLPCDSLINIDKAAQIVLDGLKDHKKFFVHVDSDNDGVSAGSIMYRYLLAQGIQSDWYVSQGKQHGTSQEMFEKILECGPDVLIIVDSLDANIDRYSAIKDLGVDIIILDHHDINDSIPYDDYVTLVSSNRDYENKELCGAGVTWKFCCYLDEQLGSFDAYDLVDLACSGTLSDMMDMSEAHMENRAIVKMGLDNLQNTGLKKIVGGYNFDSRSVIFSVAPLVNASCRYSKNDDAFLTFISDENKDVLAHLKVLKNCKAQQEKDIAKCMPDLIEQAEQQLDKKAIFVILQGNSGLSGLYGNKLLEMYGRPIFVLTERTGGYSGSCRSVGIPKFRQICEDIGLIESAGHPEAFGVINIGYDVFEEFRDELENALAHIEPKMDIEADAEISVGDLNESFIGMVKDVDRISGTGFKGLTFLIHTDDYSVTTMSKGKHLVFDLGYNVKLIQWNKGSSVEDFELHETLCEELTFIGTLDKGFLGKDYSCRMICDKILS